jgi:transposase
MMVKRDMYHEIKKLQRNGCSRNRISQFLGIDIKTVRKYCKMKDEEYGKNLENFFYREKGFDVLRKEILMLYEKNEFIKLPMSAVYDYLEEKLMQLPANENSLRNYIHYLIETGQLTLNDQKRYYIKVPELPYGKQLQVDFGEIKNNGRKYYIFGSVLSASRYKYAALQEKPFRTIDLIEHLLNCFDYIGGIPEEIVVDQDSIIVTDENYGDIIYTKEFEDFKREMGFSMFVCHAADPESKGKIENLIKYVKYNFFSVRKFESLEETSESLLKWLERRANGKISQATMKIPAIEIEEERKFLKPVKNSIYRKNRTSAREKREVNDKNRIAVDASQYDVPEKYRNKTVEIYKTENRLYVFDPISGQQLVEYNLSSLPGQIVTNRNMARQTGIKTDELKEEIKAYFTIDLWNEFLENNFKQFQRYVRDQCLEARRFFKDKMIKQEILKEALTFCIENKTYSMANLKDSYIYFLTRNPAAELTVKEIPTSENRIRIELEVSKPDMKLYTSLIKEGGNVQ